MLVCHVLPVWVRPVRCVSLPVTSYVNEWHNQPSIYVNLTWKKSHVDPSNGPRRQGIPRKQLQHVRPTMFVVALVTVTVLAPEPVTAVAPVTMHGTKIHDEYDGVCYYTRVYWEPTDAYKYLKHL